MPIVSSFFGIVVRMYADEHPPPHFHAEYQGEEAAFSLDGSVMAGNIGSRRALRLIGEWAGLHGTELAANWARIERGELVMRIPPLE